MPPISTARMTSKQFLLLGEDPPGVRLELVDGEIAVSPSPTPEHSVVEKELSFILMNHIKANRLGRLVGDVDVVFAPNDVRRPDIAYFSRDRQHLIGQTAIQGPPDLCIEIVSPASRQIDRVDKFQQYQNAGVAHYWIVDPTQRSVEAYVLEAGQYRVAGQGQGNQIVQFPPFPDLTIELGSLWWK